MIPKKNGEVRLCIDMRMPNQKIQRERHPTPIVDDLVDTLNGTTVFSKLDQPSGYHQLVLAQESKYITTFVTHEGLRRYTRLNFVTNSASEIFQNVMCEQIKDIPKALNIRDQDHNQALDSVLHKFTNVGLTLKLENVSSTKLITFFWVCVFIKRNFIRS